MSIIKKLGHLVSAETQRVPAEIKPNPVPFHGPQTSELRDRMKRGGGLSPLEYCIRFGLPSEWAAFQKTVSDRVALEPVSVWEACNKCGFIFQRQYRTPAGGPCLKCNFPKYANGGFMADMTPAEVTGYQDAKAKVEAEADERMARAALYAANENRQKAGLKPLTLAEFKASERERARKIIGGFPRPTAKDRDERMARAGVLKSPGPDAELIQGPVAAPVVSVNRKDRAAAKGA